MRNKSENCDLLHRLTRLAAYIFSFLFFFSTILLNDRRYLDLMQNVMFWFFHNVIFLCNELLGFFLSFAMHVRMLSIRYVSLNGKLIKTSKKNCFILTLLSFFMNSKSCLQHPTSFFLKWCHKIVTWEKVPGKKLKNNNNDAVVKQKDFFELSQCRSQKKCIVHPIKWDTTWVGFYAFIAIVWVPRLAFS